MIWVGFVGASLAAKENKHIVVGIPEKLFPKKVPSICISICKCYYLYGNNFNCLSRFQLCIGNKEFGEASLVLNIPLWIVQIIIPASLVIIAFRFIGIGIQIFKGKISSIGAGGKEELTQIGRQMIEYLIIIVALICMVIGTPLFIILAIVTLCSLQFLGDGMLTEMIADMFNAVNKDVLLAIPFS